MSTILKETEAGAGLPEGAAARPATTAGTSADSGAKPQSVALEVSVTVNGARTVEGSDKREPFSESTKTVLVFGNGAVIRLQASVAPGQLLFLTNEKTKKEVVCQVVKSKSYRNISGYVELEFTEAVLGFWGMRFPGDRVPGPAGTPNVVQAAPATGSPVAPQIATVPTHPASSVAPVAAQPPAPANIAAPVKTASPVANAVAPSAPTAKVPTVPAVAAVPLVMKTDFTVSSSAPKTVLPLTGTLSLPRVAEAKPVAPAVVAPKIPAPAPAATVPAPPTKREPAKSAAELSAESLRAENARLQEQLAALLNPQKNSPAPVTSAPPPVSSTPESAKPVAPVPAKVVEIAKAQVTKPETVTTPGKPDSWLPDLAAMLAKDAEANKEAIAPAKTPAAAAPVATVTPDAPSAPKAFAPASISTASLQSLLEPEQVQLPSWLEPLARHSGTTSPAHDNASSGTELDAVATTHADAEVHDELNDVFEHRSDDLSDTLVKTEEGGVAEGHGSEASAQNVGVPTFGSRLGIDESGSTEGAGKGKLLAIAALILAAVAGGGYWYTQQSSAPTAGNAANVAAAKPQTQAPAVARDTAMESTQAAARTVPGTVATATPSGAIKNPAVTPAPVNANLVVEKTRATEPGNASPDSSAASPAQPFANVQQVTAPKHAPLGDVHLAAPNVTHKNDGGAISDAEVSLGSAESSESAPAMNGFVSGSGPAAPAIPLAVGGSVTPAKLLKSVAPVYPAFAKTQRVSGNVTIDALIDATGRVTTMKVINGPTVLHQAAMDALQQWKYQPANLDGKAVPIHLTVTIQFRMQ
jgi:TonB family protein